MADDDLDITLRDPEEGPSLPGDGNAGGGTGRRRRRWPWFIFAALAILLLVGGVVMWLLGRTGDEHFALRADPAHLEGVTGTSIFTTVTAEHAEDLVWFAVSTEGGDAFRPAVADTFVGRELGVSIRPRFGEAGDGSISITVVGCGVEEQECPEAEQQESSIEIPIAVAEPTAEDVPSDLSLTLGGRVVEEDGTPIVRDELFVMLEITMSEADGRELIRQIAADSGAVITGADATMQIYQLAFPGASLEETRAHIDDIKAVDGVDDAVIRPLAATDEVRPRTPWQRRAEEDPTGTGWHHQVLNDASVRRQGADGVRIAIVDTGIYYDHPDLTDNVVHHATASGSLIDADGDHGTHTAGLACADGENSFGVSGISSRCDLALYDVGPHVSCNGCSSRGLDGGAILMSLRDAAFDGAAVISMSIGIGPACGRPVSGNNSEVIASANAAYERPIIAAHHAATQGTLTAEPLWVFSAGNGCVDGRLASPGALASLYPNVLAVGSVDEDLKLSDFSNAGDNVAVAAPGGTNRAGTDVLSSIWQWCVTDDFSIDIGAIRLQCRRHAASTLFGRGIGFHALPAYDDLQGTSMAAPEVAGVAAIVKARHPSFSARQVKQCILASSQRHPVGFTAGRDRSVDQRVEASDLDSMVIVDAAAAAACTRPDDSLEPPTSTAFVMDVSTSMDDYTQGDETKLVAAQRAATDVIRTLQIEADRPAAGTQEASVVAFSTDSNVYHASSADLDSVERAVNSLYTVADTNIGDGLSTAFDELDTRSAPERVAILLSDGETNTGLSPSEILSEIVPRFTDAGIKIFTIGFGAPGSLDEDLLRQIATQTGGTYSYAETTQALQQAFIRSRHEATGRVVSETEGVASANAAVEAGTFDVTADEGLVNISLAAESAGLDMVLVDPLGNTVDVSGGNVQITETEGLSTAFVTAPLPGQWHLEVRGSSRVEGESYYAIVSVRKRETEAPTAPVRSSERAAAAVYVSLVGAILIAISLMAWHASSVVTTEPRRRRGQRPHDD